MIMSSGVFTNVSYALYNMLKDRASTTIITIYTIEEILLAGASASLLMLLSHSNAVTYSSDYDGVAFFRFLFDYTLHSVDCNLGCIENFLSHG